MDLGDKVDKGVRIIWYGAIGLGAMIMVIGLVWFLDSIEVIDVNIWSIFALILLFVGIAIIGVGLWLRSLLKL